MPSKKPGIPQTAAFDKGQCTEEWGRGGITLFSKVSLFKGQCY